MVLLAKAYFDTNEFLRAAHVLRNARAHRGCFLRRYSLFLAGEKRKDERVLEESGGGSASVPTGKPRAINEQLSLLHTELAADASLERLDGYGYYVYGLVLRELQRPSEVRRAHPTALFAHTSVIHCIVCLENSSQPNPLACNVLHSYERAELARICPSRERQTAWAAILNFP